MNPTRIKGWMNLKELDWLKIQAHEHKVMVEIGVFMGRSTYALCKAGKWMHNIVIAIDSFEGTGKNEIDHEYYPGEYESIARKNLAEFIGKNLVLIKGKSGDSKVINRVKTLTNNSIDFLFIDGDHDFTEVTRDIMNYGPMVKPGGIISGHDIHLPSVRSAAHRLAPGYSTIEHIWFKKVT